ncbi:hypothetical protein LEMLEM_LOCUS25432 [Lemmus lemmus]
MPVPTPRTDALVPDIAVELLVKTLRSIALH